MATVKLSLYASLHKYGDRLDGCIEIPAPRTLRAVAEDLGIPEEQIMIATIEGERVDIDAVVRGGERVQFFPPIGGG